MSLEFITRHRAHVRKDSHGHFKRSEPSHLHNCYPRLCVDTIARQSHGHVVAQEELVSIHGRCSATYPFFSSPGLKLVWEGEDEAWSEDESVSSSVSRENNCVQRCAGRHRVVWAWTRSLSS